MTGLGDPPSDVRLAAGTLLARRYRIMRQLGSGTIGSVYLAEDQSVANRLVAVREITGMTAAEGDQAQAIDRFKREVELLNRLDHPAIPTIYDCFLDAARSRFYVVMTFIEGDTLSRRQEENGGRIDELTATQWAIDICDVLDYIHSQIPPIIYRDLKPANLMLDAHNRVTLVDFGIARFVGPWQEGEIAIGTMGYAPPEQFAGKIEPASDIYSLGATMFHLLTGHDPQDKPLLIFDFTKSPKPRELNPELTFEIEAMICRAVEHRPEARPTARAFAEELKKHLLRLHDQEASVQAPDVPVSVGSPSQQEVQFCTRCGNRWIPGHHFCTLCGEKLGSGDGGGIVEVAPVTKVIEIHEFEEPMAARPRPIYLDDNVQFTVYQPKQIRSERWYPFLAFAHLSERRPDAPAGEPDPIEEMQRQANSILGEQMSQYRTALQDSSQAIPQGGTLTFLPSVPDIEFNPPSQSFVWQESVHREEFRMRASPDLSGDVARGSLSIFLGGILLAEINLKIEVVSKDIAIEQKSSWSSSQARPYRKIFASYSQKDKFIVEQFEEFGRSLGDEYLRDLTELRSGEVWSDRLFEMIRAADVFQLFWSKNSMSSAFVSQEWRYALSLGRSNFIRPVYWETPLPEDPPGGPASGGAPQAAFSKPQFCPHGVDGERHRGRGPRKTLAPNLERTHAAAAAFGSGWHFVIMARSVVSHPYRCCNHHLLFPSESIAWINRCPISIHVSSSSFSLPLTRKVVKE